MRRLVTMVGALAAITALPSCAAHTKDGGEKVVEQSRLRYQLAADDFRGQRPEAALEELRRALEIDPDNADAYNLLGLIALSQGAEYVRQVETAGCLHGSDAESLRRDAMTKFHEAEGYLRKATVLRPSFADAWNNLAVAALQLENYDEAIVAAQNALKDVAYASPELARANLGWAEYQKKDLNSAWKALHEAVARLPGFCVGRYRLAKVYVERGQYDEAADEIDAVVSNPACPVQEAFLLGGLVHQHRGDAAGARGLFDRCVSIASRACLAAECRRYTGMVQ